MPLFFTGDTKSRIKPLNTVQVITLLISTALWPSGLGVGLFRSVHTKFLLCRFDTVMLLFFLGFGGGGGDLTSGLSKLRTLPLVPLPTGPHPARGDKWCLHVYSCLPCVVCISNGLYSATSLVSVSAVTQPSPLYSIWTWSEDGIKFNPNQTCAVRSTAQRSYHWYSTPFLGFPLVS